MGDEPHGRRLYRRFFFNRHSYHASGSHGSPQSYDAKGHQTYSDPYLADPGQILRFRGPVVAAFLLWIAITSQVNFGPVQATAFITAVIGMGLGTVGAAGMARVIGERLQPL